MSLVAVCNFVVNFQTTMLQVYLHLTYAIIGQFYKYDDYHVFFFATGSKLMVCSPYVNILKYMPSLANFISRRNVKRKLL